MTGTPIRLVAYLALVAGCGPRGLYPCTASEECVSGGEHGVCEPEGYCSFADGACPGGRKFEPNAGDGLAGTCVAADARGSADAPINGEPIEFLQATSTNFGSVMTGMLPFPSPVGPHHAIIAVGSIEPIDAVLDVTDTQGNHYVPVASFADDGRRLVVVAAFDIVGGADTVMFTTTQLPLSGYFEAYLHEYVGITALDVVAASSGTDTGTDAITSGPVQTHFANELIVGIDTCGACTNGTDFALRTNLDGNVTEDRVVTSPGVYAATSTWISGSSWIMVMAAFKGG